MEGGEDFGSGSLKQDGLLSMVAMEEVEQAGLMHHLLGYLIRFLLIDIPWLVHCEFRLEHW
ncbi:MAG TPA: hypothetical protein DCK85_02320 [Ktedonobacter sp.]|nr:hypothetical protein [Ktedonobacter sp.]